MIGISVKRLAVRIDETAIFIAEPLMRVDPHDSRRCSGPVENGKNAVLARLESSER
jgi:hypothetical protein